MKRSVTFDTKPQNMNRNLIYRWREDLLSVWFVFTGISFFLAISSVWLVRKFNSSPTRELVRKLTDSFLLPSQSIVFVGDESNLEDDRDKEIKKNEEWEVKEKEKHDEFRVQFMK